MKTLRHLCYRHRIDNKPFLRPYNRYNARSPAFMSKSHNASRDIQYPKSADASDATDRTSRGLKKCPIVLTTSRTRRCAPSVTRYPKRCNNEGRDFRLYVYGVLHAPSYRERFANDLSKEIPRIPFAPDFHAFAEAGKSPCRTYTLVTRRANSICFPSIFAHDGDPQPHHFQVNREDDASSLPLHGATLIINDHMRCNRHTG